MITSVTSKITTVQAVADRNSRSASELARIAGRSQEESQATDGLDDVDAELFADPADEDFDGVGVAVEILVIEVLDELGPRYHPTGVVHKVGQQAIFVRCQLDRIAFNGDAAGPGIQTHRPAIELTFGVAGRAAQQCPHPGQNLFEVKWLGDIVVGASIEPLD